MRDCVDQIIFTGEMTAHTLLPDGLVKPCVGVLEVMSVSERDLVRLVVEVINEIRDVFSVQPEDETVRRNSTSPDFSVR